MKMLSKTGVRVAIIEWDDLAREGLWYKKNSITAIRFNKEDYITLNTGIPFEEILFNIKDIQTIVDVLTVVNQKLKERECSKT